MAKKNKFVYSTDYLASIHFPKKEEIAQKPESEHIAHEEITIEDVVKNEEPKLDVVADVVLESKQDSVVEPKAEIKEEPKTVSKPKAKTRSKSKAKK